MSENLYSPGQKSVTKEFLDTHDKMRWNCRKCSQKECICNAEIYTSWSKLTKIKNKPKYVFNHISKGYSEDETKPKPVDKAQKKLWKNAKWQKKKVFMKDGRIIE